MDTSGVFTYDKYVGVFTGGQSSINLRTGGFVPGSSWLHVEVSMDNYVQLSTY